MADASLRERLIERLKTLTDAQVAALLHVADVMQSLDLERLYDESKDGAIAFFEDDLKRKEAWLLKLIKQSTNE